jgi:nucleoside-diphosphate-sugar epimerase
LLLITGATGLVGSHVAQRARELGLRTRALVRAGSDTRSLDQWGVEKTEGELTVPSSLAGAVSGATLVVHCAARVGDWGPVDDYRAVNVRGLEHLLNAVESAGSLRHFVHLSSQGVYEFRDHHGTDESVEPSPAGMDGYTLTKVEAEKLILRHVREKHLPATVIRPGFIYGPRDRTVLPRLLARLKTGQVRYFGSGEKLLNNTFVGNLVDVIFDVLDKPDTVGEIFNVTDGALVSKRDFISTVATLAGYDVPRAAVPLGVARLLTMLSEKVYHWLGRKEAPLLSKARFKFLGLNLDYSIDKARRRLGYNPRVSFNEGMQQTIDWFRKEGKL